jgi:hypothetical protein
LTSAFGYRVVYTGIVRIAGVGKRLSTKTQ